LWRDGVADGLAHRRRVPGEGVAGPALVARREPARAVAPARRGRAGFAAVAAPLFVSLIAWFLAGTTVQHTTRGGRSRATLSAATRMAPNVADGSSRSRRAGARGGGGGLRQSGAQARAGRGRTSRCRRNE